MAQFFDGYKNSKSEILEPIHELANEFAEMIADNRTHYNEFTDIDILATTIVFMTVVSNRRVHAYMEEGMSRNLDDIAEEMNVYHNRIKDLVSEMTGYDITIGTDEE